MQNIKFKYKQIDKNWKVIKYQIDDTKPQSFTCKSINRTLIPATIVNRVNPRGGRQWAAKKFKDNKEWQGIILFQ